MQLTEQFIKALVNRGYAVIVEQPHQLVTATTADAKGRRRYIQIDADERPQMYAKVKVTVRTTGNKEPLRLLDRSYTKSDFPKFLTDLSYLNF